MFGTKTIAIAAAAMAFAATGIQGVHAAPRDQGYGYGRHADVGRIHYRIARQERRIRRGRSLGLLNWVEARRLRFELSHIRGFKARYLSDGWLNWREGRHLNHLLNQNSRRIRRMSFNGRGGRGYERPRYRRDRTDRREPRLTRYNGFARY